MVSFLSLFVIALVLVLSIVDSADGLKLMTTKRSPQSSPRHLNMKSTTATAASAATETLAVDLVAKGRHIF